MGGGRPSFSLANWSAKEAKQYAMEISTTREMSTSGRVEEEDDEGEVGGGLVSMGKC